MASLNLKAGKRAVAFSDFNAALKLFEHGLSFLTSDSWSTHYLLTVDLFDAAAEAGRWLPSLLETLFIGQEHAPSHKLFLIFVTACITNDRKAVTLHSNEVVRHATCFDDKLNCEWTSASSFEKLIAHAACVDNNSSGSRIFIAKYSIYCD